MQARVGSSSVLSGDDVFQIISSNSIPISKKLDIIVALKSHFKRDRIDLSQTPKYFNSLMLALDIKEISNESFSSISHLVKRVATQDGADYLIRCSSSIVPILIERLGASSSMIKSSKSALEAFILSTHKTMEYPINSIGLNHRDPKVVIGMIEFLDNLSVQKKNFNLQPYLSSIVKAINDNQSNNEVVETIIKFLTSYYIMGSHRFDKFDLSKELNKQSIDNTIKDRIMSGINKTNVENMSLTSSNIRHPKLNYTGHSIPPLAQPVVESTNRSDMHVTNVKFNINSSITNDTIDTSEQLIQKEKDQSPPLPPQAIVNQSAQEEDDIALIISKLTNYQFDKFIKPRNIHSVEDLHHIINRLLPAFSSKETEHNWSIREKSMITLRELIRGNAITEYLEEFKHCMRDLTEGICKSISSLRTTLSSHGCNFIKELSMKLGDSFDSLVEYFLPTLLKSCTATKNIASINAHVTICSIFINCSFSSRFINRINLSANDKNTKLRSYSATWLQIMIIRFSNHLIPTISASSTQISYSQPSQSNAQSQANYDIAFKVIIKLLSDSSPAVRSSSKDAYWTFAKFFPNELANLTSKLEPHVLKAIGRSQPSNKPSTSIHKKSSSLTNSNISSNTFHNYSSSTNFSSHSSSLPGSTKIQNKPKLSVKDTIIAKNKELRERQRELLSRPASRVPSEPNSIDLHGKERSSSRLSKSVSHAKSLTRSKLEKKPKPSRGASMVADTTRINSSASSASTSTSPTVWRPTIPVAPFQRASTLTHNNDDDNNNYNDKAGARNMINPTNHDSVAPQQIPDEPNPFLSTTPILKPNTDPIRNQSSPILDDVPLTFDPQSDPIIPCLSSDNPDIIKEGISLLIYAIQAKEEFSLEVNNLLTKISMNQIEVLEPLFKEIKFERVLKFFKVNDLFRIICILIRPITKSFVEELSKSIELNAIYDAINTLLGYCIQIDNLDDVESSLVNQLIKYKSTVIQSIIEFMICGLNKIPITDRHFSITIVNLFNLVNLIKSTPIIDIYSNLLNQLYNINSNLFMNELNQMDSKIREEIGIIVGFDGLTEFNSTIARVLEAQGVDHFTQIDLPNSDNYNLSPIKLADDFTMITPSQDELNKSIKMSSIKEDEMEIDDPSSSNSNKSFDQNIQKLKPSPVFDESKFNDNNVFFQSGNLNHSHISASSSSSSSNKSKELIHDLENVTITDKQKFIQSMVEKVDPLKSISNKNKPINIYEDETDYRGSPKKLTMKYDYTELNWFNFQLANLTIEDNDFTKKEFDYYCKILGENLIETTDFYKLLNVLQSSSSFDMDFTNYFYGEGLIKVQENLWKFFEKNLINVSNNNSKSNQSKLLKGLILLKQLLINRTKISHNKIFRTLNELSKINDDNLMNEFEHAISEIFDEMIGTTNESRSNLLNLIIQELNNIDSQSINSDDGDNKGNKIDNKIEQITFNLDCINRIINQDLINDLTMNEIDKQIFKYISNDKIEIRRFVILIYGKLLKYGNDNVSKITIKLTSPQRKLVEYYSEV